MNVALDAVDARFVEDPLLYRSALRHNEIELCPGPPPGIPIVHGGVVVGDMQLLPHDKANHPRVVIALRGGELPLTVGRAPWRFLRRFQHRQVDVA